jgi:hypothetical protein
MPPLQFSDEEMDLLLSLSQPIEPWRRTEFLTAVAAELEASGEMDGPGVVHRVARQVQRKFWEPPRETDPGPQRRIA